MKISRRGASSDFGESSIELSGPAFSWNPANSCITIKKTRVKDFSTDSRHNYSIAFSLPEVQGLLQAVSEAAALNPKILEKELESSLKSLLRIQAAVAGTVG